MIPTLAWPKRSATIFGCVPAAKLSCGERVSQLVGIRVLQPGLCGRVDQLLAEQLGRDSPTPAGQEELHQAPIPRVAKRAARRAASDDAIDDGERLFVQGDHALSVQLPEGDLEPRP